MIAFHRNLPGPIYFQHFHFIDVIPEDGLKVSPQHSLVGRLQKGCYNCAIQINRDSRP